MPLRQHSYTCRVTLLPAFHHTPDGYLPTCQLARAYLPSRGAPPWTLPVLLATWDGLYVPVLYHSPNIPFCCLLLIRIYRSIPAFLPSADSPHLQCRNPGPDLTWKLPVAFFPVQRQFVLHLPLPLLTTRTTPLRERQHILFRHTHQRLAVASFVMWRLS